jgi:hypothetical protein
LNQISDRLSGRRLVEANFFFGGTGKHVAVVAWHQVSWSIVDYSTKWRRLATKQHHLAANRQDSRRDAELA